MSIASMTAFSRKSEVTEWGMLTWEIRTLNHRYLEIFLRLPQTWYDIEQISRKTISKYLTRGKIEATFIFEGNANTPIKVSINELRVQQLSEAIALLSKYIHNVQTSSMDILSSQGVFQIQENLSVEIKEKAISLLIDTLSDINKIRQGEGEGIVGFIISRLEKIEKLLLNINHLYPNVLILAQQKIVNRFSELSIQLDQERLVQEMTWLAQKLDIAEEAQRLETHVKEVKKILHTKKIVGRRLDFLTQELNREANTLASKSIDAEITQMAVEIKVLIEQIKEQVQNLE